MDIPHISIVSPVYNGELLVDELVKRLVINLERITNNFEIILVEDGGPDKSWDSICRLSKNESRVRGVKLSRNFGQHNAISAGLDLSRGQWVIVMDCDLQDLPEEIPNLYNAANEGFFIVLGKRKNRKDSLFKWLFSSLFYKILGYLTGSNQDSSIANFGIYHRKVVDTLKSMRESIRYFPTMIAWVGFKTRKIEVDHGVRLNGKSSYDFQRLLNLALDIILAYSDKPLRLTIKFGLVISLITFAFALITAVRAIRGEIEVTGYASLIISVWLLGGFIIVILGIIGLYIGKTFEGVKSRPNYIVESATWEK